MESWAATTALHTNPAEALTNLCLTLPSPTGGMKQKGIITYGVAPNRQNPFAGAAHDAIFNTWRRFSAQVLYWAPPMIVGYYAMNWAIERYRLPPCFVTPRHLQGSQLMTRQEPLPQLQGWPRRVCRLGVKLSLRRWREPRGRRCAIDAPTLLYITYRSEDRPGCYSPASHRHGSFVWLAAIYNDAFVC